MVFVARLSDCPAASVYGPVTTAADTNTGNVAAVAIAMALESKVTAPLRANSRPSTAAPVVTVMEVKARMFPFKTEVVPSVAELKHPGLDVSRLGAAAQDDLATGGRGQCGPHLEDEDRIGVTLGVESQIA